MKKKLLSMMFIMLISNLFSVDQNQKHFFEESIYENVKGDYVFYYDNRGENPVLVGIMFLNENLYRVRYYDYATDENSFITLSINYTPEKITMDFLEVLTSDDSLEAIFEYTKLFNTLINMDDRVDKAYFPNDPSYTQTYDKDDISYEHEIIYKYWVPVFQAYSIHQTIPTEKSVTLVAISKENEENSLFETFKYFPSEEKYRNTKITTKELNSVSYGDITFEFDSNWEQDESGLLILSNDTVRDAAISLSNWTNNSTLEYAGLHFAYIKLINNSNFIPANTINIKQYDDRTVLEYDVFDPNTQRYSIMIEMLFDLEETMYIYSLSAFKSVFQENQEYFNSILRSVQVIQ